MTEHLKITAKIPRKRYVANGSQTVFSFDFVLFQPSELLVTVNGVAVASGVAVALLTDGTGTATFAAAPAAGAVVVLQRRVTIKRETDFQEGGELRAKTLNDEFDFQTAALQQVETAAARALQLPIDDADNAATVLPIAALRATKMLGFDSSGNPTLSNQTLAQIEDGSNAAAASAAAAASSQNAAATSATNAATAQGVAAANAATATARASDAAASAAAASTSASAAATSKTGSDASATSAAASAANASASATTASNAASAASANATAAASSQTAAANSAANAASSAISATTSATNAQNSATSAGTQATNAANSASAAAASAASIALPLPVASGGTGATAAAAARANLGLGSAATLTVGSGANQVPQLDALGRLPAVDGSQLTNLTGASMQVTAGEALAIRDLIYQDIFNQRGGGADRWYRVDTDATAPVRISPRIGIALAAIASGASGNAQVRSGRVSGYSGLAAGQAVFASTTAGAITQTAPAVPATATQNATRLIGFAASATEIDFDPDDDTVFTARNSALASGGTLVVEHYPDSGGRERTAAAYLVAAALQQVQVPQGAGTALGNMTSQGGLAAGFDGVTSQTTAAAPRAIGTGGIIGKDWGAGAAKIVSGVRIWTPNNERVNNAAADTTITITLKGSTDNFSSSNVTLGSFAFTDNVLTGIMREQLSGFTTTTAYRYHRIEIASSGSFAGGGCGISELMFFEDVVAYDEPISPVPESLNGSATNQVTARFADASNANADRFTTFRNRTNAMRDLAAEVIL